MKSVIAPTDLPQPGDRVLEKYRVERVIGEGGAGVVYAAHHELLDQRIALKVIAATHPSEAATRFINEAKLVAKIRSDHVCRVMDVGFLPNGLAYIAMEYLEGKDLDAVVARGRVPAVEAVDYVLQACDALAHAHQQGIVHRDLKPANLFLASNVGQDRPIVKVLDFGISKAGLALGEDTNLTSSRVILGSPSYMSPEQIKNARTVDARTDIWSLGVILYELLVGVAPFKGETVGEVFAKIIEATPAPIRNTSPNVPAELEAIVLRCLAKDREQRFANVGELAQALAPFAGDAAAVIVARVSRVLSAPPPAPTPADARVSDPPKSRAKEAPTVAAGETVHIPMTRRSRLGPALVIGAALGGGALYVLSSERGATHDGISGIGVSPSSRARFDGILDALVNVVTSLGDDDDAGDARTTASASASASAFVPDPSAPASSVVRSTQKDAGKNADGKAATGGVKPKPAAKK